MQRFVAEVLHKTLRQKVCTRLNTGAMRKFYADRTVGSRVLNQSHKAVRPRMSGKSGQNLKKITEKTKTFEKEKNMSELKILRCSHCGNIVTYIENKGVPVVCCGEKMTVLNANTTDAATEKHVPVWTREGNTVSVKVGSVNHPMTEEHHIAWIILKTCCGVQIKYLAHDAAPAAEFCVADGEKVEEVYAYCNLHGLWKA